MRSDGVVVLLPISQDRAGVSERAEQCLVQQLIAEPAVEALNEGVLRGLARRDVVPFDLGLLRPAQDRHAGELGAVVGNARRGSTALGDDRVELTRDANAR